jgi:hypothetical protein
MWLSGGLLAVSGRSRGPVRKPVGSAIKSVRCEGKERLTVN